MYIVVRPCNAEKVLAVQGGAMFSMPLQSKKPLQVQGRLSWMELASTPPLPPPGTTTLAGWLAAKVGQRHTVAATAKYYYSVALASTPN